MLPYVTVHTGAETIQGRKLFAEIRYIKYQFQCLMYIDRHLQDFVVPKSKSIFIQYEFKQRIKQTQLYTVKIVFGWSLVKLTIM